MLGYFLALLTGMSLGLLGGGGSILTVPILVYAMGMDAKLSVALSLAIVAVTSLIGVWGHYRNNNIDFKIAAVFAPFAMAGTFLGAKLSVFLSGQVQLILFALIMLAASYFMLKKSKSMPAKEAQASEKKLIIPLIASEGVIVGIITGLVGVGGGFLIVPALTLLAGIDMKKAVGTSLIIISLKSFSGFFGYMNLIEIPWGFLAMFILFSGIGIILGSYLVRFISQEKLKKSFAIFLIVMGSFILYQNRSVFAKDQALHNDNSTHTVIESDKGQ